MSEHFKQLQLGCQSISQTVTTRMSEHLSTTCNEDVKASLKQLQRGCQNISQQGGNNSGYMFDRDVCWEAGALLIWALCDPEMALSHREDPCSFRLTNKIRVKATDFARTSRFFFYCPKKRGFRKKRFPKKNRAGRYIDRGRERYITNCDLQFTAFGNFYIERESKSRPKSKGCQSISDARKYV